jgi:hypothetical protein
MPEGIGYGPNVGGNVRAEQQLIQQQNQNRDTSVQRREQQEDAVQRRQNTESIQQQEALQSEAGRSEQRQRDERLRTDTADTSNQLRAPDSQTVQQLELNAANRREQQENVSGLGQTAVNSYNSLQVRESNESLSESVKVDFFA